MQHSNQVGIPDSIQTKGHWGISPRKVEKERNIFLILGWFKALKGAAHTFFKGGGGGGYPTPEISWSEPSYIVLLLSRA